MEQTSIDLWQNHSIRFLEMVFRAGKRERLSHPYGYGRHSRECGDTVEIFLMVHDGKVESAAFETNGCLYSVACANAVVHLVEGRSLGDAWDLDPREVLDYLETLPEKERHCADLAVASLRAALLDAQDSAKNPWKRFYR